ncbi:MAG: hypothetical protein BWK73_20230 [Thiothrix lacustris]|uniref:Uncharacterized protein n=1 Tax=Thiothrix lacustris TaxID=525917 RepID=A0A1Y1QP83_9GAMM|nr:MAG: hypothetical protein BWK73_20230 [Thiothrix lacustris]
MLTVNVTYYIAGQEDYFRACRGYRSGATTFTELKQEVLDTPPGLSQSELNMPLTHIAVEVVNEGGGAQRSFLISL